MSGKGITNDGEFVAADKATPRMMRYPSIHEKFSNTAARFPDHVAISCAEQNLTYRDLERRSDAIARYLISRGIGVGARVGTFASRSLETIAAFLGILKAGAAYVPFDPSYPPALLRFVYQDCAPAAMLVQPDLLQGEGLEPFWDGDFHDIKALVDDSPLSLAGTLPAVTGEEVAYVMYTSGSTGHPKGVLVPHRGVVRLVVDTDFVQLGPDHVHLQLAPLAFDASTFEIWGALLNGGRLAVLPSPHPSLDDIARHIEVHGVSTLWLTAGLFHLMVDQRLDGLAPLRQLIAGGDILSATHVARVLKQLPKCQLINGYGPTENTTFTCCYRIPRDLEPGAVPIGFPISGTSVYILDGDGNQVADGEAGELVTGGAGVALGYLNRAPLTAERFVADPFDPTGTSTMYRTGDRVRRRSDGAVEFLGRVDRQVKITGKRVELDEIEACLRRSTGVEDAAVTSPPAQTGSRKIHAYVKLRLDQAATPEMLKSFLRAELPDYMQPASLTVLSEFPLSATGKVDRAKLPLPAMPNAASAAPAPAALGDGVEATILRIWREVLGDDPIGLNDNFFDLGGTSLQLMQVHATIVTVMNSDVTVVELFQFPSISTLARHLQSRGELKTEIGPTKAAGVMLSNEERARRQQAALARVRGNPRRPIP